ncbi:hypothetical protein AAFF_G00146650 [Aldrovandia affinis]|uniref:Uncharacterized protein n=1 Tax=Aldrovandia affinis TaxID=143900 RepID=A0AAD7W8R0_9TELE|nr:hypothetical protein AAFF_G00146650 [Aldrovandia affinis]
MRSQKTWQRSLPSLHLNNYSNDPQAVLTSDQPRDDAAVVEAVAHLCLIEVMNSAEREQRHSEDPGVHNTPHMSGETQRAGLWERHQGPTGEVKGSLPCISGPRCEQPPPPLLPTAPVPQERGATADPACRRTQPVRKTPAQSAADFLCRVKEQLRGLRRDGGAEQMWECVWRLQALEDRSAPLQHPDWHTRPSEQKGITEREAPLRVPQFENGSPVLTGS